MFINVKIESIKDLNANLANISEIYDGLTFDESLEIEYIVYNYTLNVVNEIRINTKNFGILMQRWLRDIKISKHNYTSLINEMYEGLCDTIAKRYIDKCFNGFLCEKALVEMNKKFIICELLNIMKEK